MGTYVNGMYLPALAETGYDDEVNLNFRRVGDLGLNVKAHPFNAVGDGVANDTAAIQAAITATGWPTTAGHVYFPTGTYKLNSGLTLNGGGASSTPELHLVGNGATLTTATPGITMLTITNSIVSVTRVKLRGLFFDINAGAAATGVLLNNAELCEFVGCGFGSSFSTGIKITGTSTYNRFVSCEFVNMARGIHINGNAQHLLVQGCAFGEQLIGSPLNWIEADNAGAPATLVTLMGNTFYGTGGTLPLVRILNGDHWVVSGNQFVLAPQEALWIGTDGSSYAHSVTGNVFYQGSRHDIYVNGGRHNTITGNVFGERAGGVAADTFANVRIVDTFGGTDGDDNTVVGNRSRDSATAITNIVQADATCQNLVIVGNSGLAGISAPHATTLALHGPKPTGVAVTAAGVHAALVQLGLISA